MRTKAGVLIFSSPIYQARPLLVLSYQDHKFTKHLIKFCDCSWLVPLAHSYFFDFSTFTVSGPSQLKYSALLLSLLLAGTTLAVASCQRNETLHGHSLVLTGPSHISQQLPKLLQIF